MNGIVLVPIDIKCIGINVSVCQRERLVVDMSRVSAGHGMGAVAWLSGLEYRLLVGQTKRVAAFVY